MARRAWPSWSPAGSADPVAAGGASRMRASSASTPAASASRGLMSSSATVGRSAASWPSAIRTSHTASRSAGGRCRKPASSRATRVRPMRSAASTRFSGGRPTLWSAVASTATPPWPNSTTGPNTGSLPMPAISSTASPRRTMACTAKPAILACGRNCASRARMAASAAPTAASSSRSSITPPTSDLWVTSGDTSFRATG